MFIVLPIIDITACCFGSWSCETCFSDDPLPDPIKQTKTVTNAWDKPLPYASVPKPLADALENNTADDTWTPPKDDGFTEVVYKKKNYRSKGGAGMKPVEIRCKKCENFFIYSVGQQKKYRARGWKQPKVCKSCAHKRHKKQ
jgi:hypothetical protein